MKPKDIREMDKATLNEKILDLKKELVKINAQVAIGTAIKNPGQIRKIKKNIARILTIKNPEDKNKKQEAGKKV